MFDWLSSLWDDFDDWYSSWGRYFYNCIESALQWWTTTVTAVLGWLWFHFVLFLSDVWEMIQSVFYNVPHSFYNNMLEFFRDLLNLLPMDDFFEEDNTIADSIAAIRADYPQAFDLVFALNFHQYILWLFGIWCTVWAVSMLLKLVNRLAQKFIF